MYKINQIGWIGLILTMITIFASCKKDETPTPREAVVVSPSVLIGKYANNDADVLTRDTIYIYESGINYYMTCPDNNCIASTDTIGIIIDNLNLTIPIQSIYGGMTITGYGNKVLASQLTLTWNTPSYTKSNIIYYKQ